MAAWGFASLFGSIVLVVLLIVDWERSNDGLGAAWIASADTIVFAILAGSAAICGVVLIVADLLHDALRRLLQAQQSDPEGRTAGRTFDDP